MYLHIGRDTVIPASSVVGIYDLDTTTFSKHTRALISGMEKSGRVVRLYHILNDIPKSAILCVEGGEALLYMTQLSSSALLRRSKLLLGE